MAGVTEFGMAPIRRPTAQQPVRAAASPYPMMDPGSDAARRAQAAQTAQYQRQSDELQRAAQQRVREDEDRRMQVQANQNQLEAQRRASEMQRLLMADQSNPRTTTGLESEISNAGTLASGGGGSSARASASAAAPPGGLNIGGGAFQNLLNHFQTLATAAPPTPPARVPPPSVPSTPNALGPAKEATARIGNKALEQLRNEMTSRGMSDSGMAVEGEANILGNVARGQSQAMFDAANLDNSRQWESNKLGYAGDQDYNEMIYSGQLGQRNTDLQTLLSIMRMFPNG